MENDQHRLCCGAPRICRVQYYDNYSRLYIQDSLFYLSTYYEEAAKLFLYYM